MSTGQKILIVDDDPDFVEVSRAVLRSRGYTVDSAHDGDEAMKQMLQNPPDLVLLDVMMAWPLEGVSVSQNMMDSGVLRGVPIIMITSIRSTEYRHVFPQDQYLHIDRWLDKPCSPDELISEVEGLIGSPLKSPDTA